MCSVHELVHFFARTAFCAAVVAGAIVWVDSTRSQTIAISDLPYTTHPSILGKSKDKLFEKGVNKAEVYPRPLPTDQKETIEWGLGKPFRGGSIISSKTPHRFILFSFDDGPDRRTTPLLMDRLDAAGIKAVFFLIGNRMGFGTPIERQHAEIAREIIRRGHIVASHTYDHLQLPLLNNDEALEQIVKTERIFRKVLGSRPWIIRPPGGAHSVRIDKMLMERGYSMMLWNLGAGDFQVRTAKQVLRTWQRVFDRREREENERGGIVMLHDTYPWSVDAFQLIVSDLMDRNCRLLSQNQELYDIVDDPSFFFHPRDNSSKSFEGLPVAPNKEILESRQKRLRYETVQRCSMSQFK